MGTCQKMLYQHTKKGQKNKLSHINHASSLFMKEREGGKEGRGERQKKKERKKKGGRERGRKSLLCFSLLHFYWTIRGNI